MFKFLAFLLLLGLFGFLLVGVLLGRVIRFFGSSDKNKKRRSSGNKSHSQDSSNTPKRFSKNEGEYVDYEEIKDEE